MSEDEKNALIWPQVHITWTMLIWTVWILAGIGISEVTSCSENDRVGAATHRCELGGREHGCIPSTSRAESYTDTTRQSWCRCAQPGGVRAYYYTQYPEKSR